jgi:hypothetical protein
VKERAVSRKRWLPFLGLGALAAVGVGLWVGSGPLNYLSMGVNFAAKQTCSCMHIAGRTLESCQTDLPAEGQGLIHLTPGQDDVRASAAFGLVSARAKRDPVNGCVLTH